jgi:hypothetical protein
MLPTRLSAPLAAATLAWSAGLCTKPRTMTPRWANACTIANPVLPPAPVTAIMVFLVQHFDLRSTYIAPLFPADVQFASSKENAKLIATKNVILRHE